MYCKKDKSILGTVTRSCTDNSTYTVGCTQNIWMSTVCYCDADLCNSAVNVQTSIIMMVAPLVGLLLSKLWH